MTDWMLSEESWSKSRNWARRVCLLAVFAAFAGIAVSTVMFLAAYRLTWSDLERYYLSPYLWVASPSVLSSASPVQMIVVSAPPGRDFLATSTDVVKRDGVFALTDAARRRGATTVGVRQYLNASYGERYWKLRDHIYDGRSVWQLLRVPRLAGFFVFVGVLAWGIRRDYADRQAKKSGVVEQGSRLISPEEFNEIHHGNGIGLAVRGAAGTVHIRIPESYEPQSMVIVGDSGAGKTVAFKQLIDQIEKRGDLAVIHDPKADYLPTYFAAKRGDVVLNPLDSRSPFWNPIDEVLQRHDVEMVANAFFPDRPGDKESFWTESPRKLMTVFLEKRLSAAEMTRLFQDENELDRIVAGSRYASVIDPKSPGQRNGVISELTKLAQVLQWLPSEREAKSRWSAAQWAANPQGWLFLSSKQDQSSALQTLYAVWLDLLINRVLAKRFDKRVWFILDELPVLRQVPTLQKLMTLGRECNVPLIIGLQGRAQLDERYGQNGAEVILSQPVTKIFLRTSEPKAAKWISDSIGVQALERVREGVTSGIQDWRDSVNYTPERRIEATVLDSVIASLPNLRGYFKFLEHVVEIAYEPKNRPARAEPFLVRPIGGEAPPAAKPAPVLVPPNRNESSKPVEVEQPKLKLWG